MKKKIIIILLLFDGEMCTAASVSSFDNLNHIDAPSTWTCRYDRRILTQQALI